MQSQQELRSISQSWKKSKCDNITLLAKANSNTVKVLISKVLTNSYISHYEIVSVNNVLREYHEVKQEIKNFENVVEYAI